MNIITSSLWSSLCASLCLVLTLSACDQAEPESPESSLSALEAREAVVDYIECADTFDIENAGHTEDLEQQCWSEDAPLLDALASLDDDGFRALAKVTCGDGSTLECSGSACTSTSFLKCSCINDQNVRDRKWCPGMQPNHMR